MFLICLIGEAVFNFKVCKHHYNFMMETKYNYYENDELV